MKKIYPPGAKQLYAYTDGSIEGGNPGGHGASAWVLKKGGKIIAQEAIDLGRHKWMTNNIAEYEAVYGLLDSMVQSELFGHELIIHSDSKLIVNQILGNWCCGAPRLKPLLEDILERIDILENEGGSVDLRWVPRDQNEEADALSRTVYR